MGTKHPERVKNPSAERPKLKNRDMDALVKAAWDADAWCVRGGNQHVKVYPVDGSRMIPIPSTPSDHRTVRNKKAALRRAGIPV